VHQANCSLTHLDIRNNGITDDGAKHLGSGLFSNTDTHLHLLNLQKNPIVSEGKKALTRAIERGDLDLQINYE
jgi:hypothetical protein